MKQTLKYLLAAALGFGACFSLIALGMSQSFDVPVNGHTFTCFKAD